jgi:hypothetical protein
VSAEAIDTNKSTQQELPMTPKQVQRILRAEGDAFLTRFLKAYPDATVLRSKEPAVCWADSGVLNYAVVAEYSGPTATEDGAPLLFRIRVNLNPPPALQHHLRSAAVRRRLRVPTPPEIAKEPVLEVTTLPDEIGEFGTWVRAWSDAQSRGATQAPKPPIPLFVWDLNVDLTERREELVSRGRKWRQYTYLWTARAIQLFGPWLKEDES